jgi:YidC/Oxa1 family membrane protein insertase
MQMDYKKTILWAVFSMSGLMLYNNWQVHEGKPSMFGGNSASNVVATDKAPSNKVDIPSPVQNPNIPASNQAPAVSSSAIESSEKFVLQNDVLALEISANGGNIINAKLPKQLT